MKVNVSDATPRQLDFLVAKCQGVALVLAPFRDAKNFVMVGQNNKPTAYQYIPSSAWAQGGPIIERERIDIVSDRGSELFIATPWRGLNLYTAPTPLIAAMRCYVASKLGEYVDVPEELV